MSKSFIRYRLADGKFKARLIMENEYPDPTPRDETEGVRFLTPAETDLTLSRPAAFRYDRLEVEALYVGELIVSTESFYPTLENFEELHPELEDTVYIMVRFPDMPQGAEIAARINDQEIVLENYDYSPTTLKSTAPGVFVVTLTDARCFAEKSSIIVNCLSLPE